MTYVETFRTSMEAIRAHRLRSALTMLGILIGIAAVILTVGLGQGAQVQVREEISKLGSNLLIVTPGSTTSSSGIRGGRGSASTLTVADAEALDSKAVAPDILRVAATSTSSQSVTAGTTNWTTTVTGTTPSWLQVRARTLEAGRFLAQDDVDQARPVVVLGADTVAELFPRGQAVGSTVSITAPPSPSSGCSVPSAARARRATTTWPSYPRPRSPHDWPEARAGHRSAPSTSRPRRSMR